VPKFSSSALVEDRDAYQSTRWDLSFAFGIPEPELDQSVKLFSSPIGIVVRTNGSMYDIYVADSGNSFIRKISFPKSEITVHTESPHPYYEKISAAIPRDAIRIPMSCKPSGLASEPDGQWAIVSCAEVGEIYKFDFNDHSTVRIAGDSSAVETEGYTDGIGSSATFRYPRDVVVSPGGAFALIAE
jgi:DNA-binding beta-propeller fold protein YncE